MRSELLQGFYLDDLFVEPLKGQVTGKDFVQHLRPWAVEVLLCLASSPGELIADDALLEAVWGPGQGSTDALSRVVGELRDALGDHVDNPRYIQTVPGRGYRLAVTPLPASRHTESIVIGAGADADGLGLFENLMRRGVFETAIAYLILGWLIIQVADIVFEQLHLPSWTGTFVTALVIAGFPIALVLSWFLEFRDGHARLATLSPSDARRRRFSRTYISVVSALAVAAVLVYIYDRQVGLPSQDAAPSVPVAAAEDDVPVLDNSIAVLPLMNIDGSAETQIFANGLVDDVINRLARVPGLRVSSRGDAFTMDPNSASQQVRKRLRVAMYVEGSVQIAGDQIRVIVQLINSATGFHIVSRTFDRPRKDFFDIRDEITDLTVSSLRVALPASTQAASTAASRRPSLDAYVLYRRGIDESRKPQSATTIASALGWFDAALEVDPEYAAAYSGKCSVYANGYQYNNDPDFIVDAETSCSRALELNPNLDIVHAALGGLYSRTGEYAEAEASYARALEIRPESVAALTGIADIYRLQQRAGEAEETLLRAVQLEPGNWRPYNSLGTFYYRQGRFAEAAEQFGKVVAIDDQNMRGFGNLGSAYMLQGSFAESAKAFEASVALQPEAGALSNLGLLRYYLGEYEAAAAALRSAIDMQPRDHLYWSNLGDVLWNGGKEDEARDAFTQARKLADAALEVNSNDAAVVMDRAWVKAMLGDGGGAMLDIERSASMLPDDPYVDYIRALILHRMGDADGAVDSLEIAVEKGYPTTVLAAEPHLAPLRSDRRFIAIIGRDKLGE